MMVAYPKTPAAFAAAMLVLALAAGGCGTANAYRSAPSTPVAAGQDQLLLNGRVLRTNGTRSLLQVLAEHVHQYRLGLYQDQRNQPVVVVDDVLTPDGVRPLAEISVSAVEKVDILNSIDGVTRYGPAAFAGAIVVRTRRGS